MSKRKFVQLASVFCLIFVAFGTNARAQSATAQHCGADQDQPAQRILANPNGKSGWHEYRNIKDVPELELGVGQFAWLWFGRDGSVFIMTEEPGEDFAAYTHYCFDRTGQLIHLRFELRTAWGWGYREEGPILKGLLTPQISEFFSTKTKERITKPEQADDIPEALKPTLYLRKSQLPFSKLLSR